MLLPEVLSGSRFRGREKAFSRKIQLIKDLPNGSPGLTISEYGTRRRFSKAWQLEVIRTLREQLGNKFVGTSNVYFAMTEGLTPLGTMAHEYLQACQALGPRFERFTDVCL